VKVSATPPSVSSTLDGAPGHRIGDPAIGALATETGADDPAEVAGCGGCRAHPRTAVSTTLPKTFRTIGSSFRVAIVSACNAEAT
jgi:hypothetical protein